LKGRVFLGGKALIRAISGLALIVSGCFSNSGDSVSFDAKKWQAAIDKVKDPVAKQEMQENKWYLEGHGLSAHSAELLREALRRDPNDIEFREKLLSYLGHRRFDHPEDEKEYADQYFWFTDHLPRSSLFTAWGRMSKRTDGENYEKALKAWEKLAKENPQDAVVLGNAGHQFLTENGKDLEYFQMAGKVDPSNADWDWEIGNSLMRNLDDHGKKAVDLKMAHRALLQFEKGAAKKSDRLKTLFKQELCWAAWKAQEFDVAEKYARIAIDAAQNTEEATATDIFFTGHSVLGLVDLHRGDQRSAVEHLVASVRSGASGSLDSFGPNFELAQALLDKGETEGVLEFLGEVSKFWKRDKVQTWVTMIKGGFHPKLSRN
jgi:tetratricopeptide (TPR) repeat protein